MAHCSFSHVVRTGMVAVLVWLSAALPSRAEPVDDLMDALQIDAMLQIMREEGIAYGGDLGNEMFSNGNAPRWQALLSDIYDVEKMRIIMRNGFGGIIEGTDADPLIRFFASDIGTEIIALELSARRAMIADEVEEAARAAYQSRSVGGDRRFEQLTEFIEINDLLEANVTGALNASFQFYRGLVDGGGFEMSESEILADVWAQESETRKDTREWLYGFLLLAYEPLEDEELAAYITMSRSPEGRLLNRGLFAGFNAMYDEISYALGLAAAQQMAGQDL